jgi:hypothetical protein
MAWVTWRQHRLQLLAALGALAALWVAALATALPMHAAYHRHALSACLPPTARSGCDLIVRHFESEFGSVVHFGDYLLFLPALIGAFVGAPLVARELEQGTFRFAWTQTITRQRWLLAKIALLSLASVALAAALSGMIVWWRHPFDVVAGRIRPGPFDVEGIVVPAYAFFALVLGVLAGTVLRRTIAAMSVTLGLFFATRFAVAQLRPHYLPLEHQRVAGTTTATHARDWIFDNALVDAIGRRITTGREDLAIVHARRAGIDPQEYLLSLGWRRDLSFQPAGRFWTFQAIEAGIFVALALALAVATVAIVRRRPA